MGEINLRNRTVQSTQTQASTMEGLGTYYLTDDPTHYEIQRTNNFIFYVSFAPDFFKGTLLEVSNNYAYNNAKTVLRISVNQSSVPHFTVNPIEVKRGNNTMKFAGTPTFNEHTLKLDDFIGAGTKDVLLAWQSKCYNVETEKVGLAADYKVNGWLYELTPDNQVVRKWQISGCWISGVSEDDYSYDSNEKHQVNATIQYDKASPYTADI